jgi:hypothetical protein
VLDDRRRVDLRAGLRHHERDGALVPLRMRLRHDAGLGHARQPTMWFSRSTEEIHSPPVLIRSFERSVMIR